MIETELQALKSKLPRGYFKTIISKTSLSEKTISKFFSGQIYRPDIHEAALQLAEEHSKRINEINKNHNRIINS